MKVKKLIRELLDEIEETGLKKYKIIVDKIKRAKQLN